MLPWGGSEGEEGLRADLFGSTRTRRYGGSPVGAFFLGLASRAVPGGGVCGAHRTEAASPLGRPMVQDPTGAGEKGEGER